MNNKINLEQMIGTKFKIKIQKEIQLNQAQF